MRPRTIKHLVRILSKKKDIEVQFKKNSIGPGSYSSLDNSYEFSELVLNCKKEYIYGLIFHEVAHSYAPFLQNYYFETPFYFLSHSLFESLVEKSYLKINPTAEYFFMILHYLTIPKHVIEIFKKSKIDFPKDYCELLRFYCGEYMIFKDYMNSENNMKEFRYVLSFLYYIENILKEYNTDLETIKYHIDQINFDNLHKIAAKILETCNLIDYEIQFRNIHSEYIYFDKSRDVLFKNLEKKEYIFF